VSARRRLAGGGSEPCFFAQGGLQLGLQVRAGCMPKQLLRLAARLAAADLLDFWRASAGVRGTDWLCPGVRP